MTAFDKVKTTNVISSPILSPEEVMLNVDVKK
jgi:hypothetical protein